jgi:hypothetical protein
MEFAKLVHLNYRRAASPNPAGNPESEAPTPKAVPIRVALPTAGINTSRMLKVDAATNAMAKISSNLREFLGMDHATRATTIPSIKYLKIRVKISSAIIMQIFRVIDLSINILIVEVFYGKNAQIEI